MYHLKAISHSNGHMKIYRLFKITKEQILKLKTFRLWQWKGLKLLIPLNKVELAELEEGPNRQLQKVVQLTHSL